MAKEMMIVFVYDTLRCMAEADDPADAVLYFHPGWVSDSQRIALCGQLMGVTHCLKAMFSMPKILTLHSGKFVIQEYGRFVLAIGSDRNIPDWMLKNRSEMLTSLIKTNHCDLQTVAAQFPGENNPRFSEKLYQMFETYLPVLQFGGYMFQSVPLLDLPKSATNIFLEATQILQHCQSNKGVLGGIILFNNKIVATQLNPKLTSRLAMIDPYRIKSPGEFIETEYDLPIGVQLLAIYIRKKYFGILYKDAEKMRSWHENDFDKIKTQKINRMLSKEPILGSMKRDKSLLFTAVPEEDITTSPSPATSPSNSKLHKDNEEPKPNIPDVVPFSNKPRVRPNKLALSFKNSVSKSIDEDNNVQQPEPTFVGQTSVCSTPLLEFKRLHGNMMSICRTSDDKFLSEALNFTGSTINDSDSTFPKADIATQEMSKEKSLTNQMKEDIFNNSLKDIKTTNEHFISAPIEKIKPSNSLNDINGKLRFISHFSIMRFGNHGLRNFNRSLSLNADDSPADDEDEEKSHVTITDPFYPVFRNDGVPISKCLYDEYLCEQYSEKPKPETSKKAIKDVTKDSKIIKGHFEGFDSMNVHSSPIRRKSEVNTLTQTKSIDLEKVEKSDPARRKSLTLPLKSLGGDKNVDSDNQSSNSLFETHRKKLSGVQLTPLMEKLSHLAFSEKSSGYSSRGITPMEFKDFALSTPCIEKSITFPKEEKSKKTIETPISDDSDTDDDENISSYNIDCTKCVLYVSGLQNMSMMLILEEEAVDNPQIIQNLWDINLKCLGPMEQLCMEPLPPGDESSESYSFLSLDPQWGTVKKGGAWTSSDVATMGYIHKNFKDDPSLTEFIIRSEDSLVYGTSCGGSETYYQESGSKQPGLPTQADLMGTAPLKSKRRLQRDHSITIF